MENCNWMPIPTNVEAYVVKYENVSRDNRDCPNVYASFIGIM